jgi:hypothetical protein
MFNLCVFNRVLPMNNLMWTVLNADIPVIHKGAGVFYIHVKYVIRNSVKRKILYHIYAYTVVSALILVMCAIRHSVSRAVL